MAAADIIIICAYFAISIGIALALSRKGGRSAVDFFLSGRKLPWWVAGTTMVATTFSADTPLAVTELVAKNGIAGNWLWWNMLSGNVLTVFFFAALWRRSGIVTDVEFIELRYSGKAAAFLRGFKALYLGMFMNIIIMGWVNTALGEILKNIFGIRGKYLILFIFASMLIVGIYSAISGLWGIAVTDMFQFIAAMAGCIILAYSLLNLPQIGGIAGLKAALPAETFNFFPTLNPGSAVLSGVMTISFSALIAHIAVQWWASWYPGAEPAGGGYVAQRMLSTKDERHSILATLWFSIAHYAIRPWPWILTALATLILYPGLPAAEKKTGYILAIRDYLPPGLMGLLVAAFLAAYMSTISTHLNWGASYLINDLYKRFIQPGKSEKHYVSASRIATILFVIFSGIASLYIDSISGAWTFIIECGAGLGPVLILRWYWWRINAWSEISAMIAPFAALTATKFIPGIEFPDTLFIIVAFTTIIWVSVTFITAETEKTKLIDFYSRIQPGGPGWSGFLKKYDVKIPSGRSLIPHLINWLMGIAMIYLFLFGTGKIIFQEYGTGISLTGLSITLFIILAFRLKNSENRT